MALIAFLFVKTVRDQRAQDAAQARQAKAAAPQPPRLEWKEVESIRERDPAFSIADLADRVSQIYVDVQSAWFQRDLRPVRRFMSDGLYQRFRIQLELMRQSGLRNVVSDVKVIDAFAVRHDHSDDFESIQFAITASMKDLDVEASLTDKAALAKLKSREPEESTEVWTFVRRMSARTRAHEELSRDRCPRCGAPVDDEAAVNRCGSCEAIVNSGHHGWVLAEITQAIEDAAVAPKGWQAARQKDPSLSMQVLEDRASILFWVWIESLSAGSTVPLTRFATPDFRSALQTRLGKASRKLTYSACAVGGVHVETINVGNGQERARVRILWSASVLEGDPQSASQSESQHRETVLTIARATTIKQRIDTGLSSARCGHCGAPLGESVEPRCSYCGEDLLAGGADWVLERAEPEEPRHTA